MVTTPDLRSLTSDADFSDEVDAQDESLRVPEVMEAALLKRATPDDAPPPADVYPTKPKGPKWRLGELRASALRLAMRKGTP